MLLKLPNQFNSGRAPFVSCVYYRLIHVLRLEETHMKLVIAFCGWSVLVQYLDRNISNYIDDILDLLGINYDIHSGCDQSFCDTLKFSFCVQYILRSPQK